MAENHISQMDGVSDCDHESQYNDSISIWEQPNKDTYRSTLEHLISQAQECSPKRSKKRPLTSSQTNLDSSDSEYSSTVASYPKRQAREEPKLTFVIIKSPDINLARVNPMKIAKSFNSIGSNMLKSVTKTNQGGISVKCHTAAQARKLKNITQLGPWIVTTEYAQSETQSKGVITGIATNFDEDEIKAACKKFGVIDVKRLTRKYQGCIVKCLSVCLTFNTPKLPSVLTIGYEKFQVKPYIPHVIRCYNCQRLGHIASNCRSKTRCVHCGGFHSFESCSQNNEPKCSRCGGSHSAAYAGCETFKLEKKIQGIRVTFNISYADAAKAIRTDISVHTEKTQNTKPPTKTHVYPKNNNSQEKQQIPTKIISNEQNSRKMVDASTQTKTSTSSQTDPTDVSNFIQVGPSLVELLIGTMQIWEKEETTDNRMEALKSLINTLFINPMEQPKHIHINHKTRHITNPNKI